MAETMNSSTVIKVAMVNGTLHRGGAGRMAATLTRAVNRHIEDVRARMFHCENTDRDSVFIGLRRTGSRPLNALLARLAGSAAVCDMGVADAIFRRSNGIDVLHLHNLHGYYLNYRKLLRAWKDRPMVWTWHDMWGATGRCGHSLACERWKSFCGACPSKGTYPGAWLDASAYEHRLKSRLLLNRPNLTIVTPSAWLAEVARQRGFSSDRICVIPNPVDLDVFAPADKREARRRIGLREDVCLALFVAAHCGHPLKGYADFFSAVEKAGMEAVAVGQMPPAPAARVRHTGSIQDPLKLVDYYAAADCLVTTSYADTYPTTVLEAIACGTPVYGYAVGGVPSQVPEPEASLVEAGNITALAAKLAAFAARGGKTEAISSSLRTCAIQRWSEARIAREYARLYRRVTGSASNHDFFPP